jgi:hypothetical protein
LLLVVAGCSAPKDDVDARVELTLAPSPPSVGPSTATSQLLDADDQPLEHAEVRLEGNMNHAGMQPVFAEAEEVRPGVYRAETEFTMGGDWFILVNVKLPDGRRFMRKIDVAGVAAQ